MQPRDGGGGGGGVGGGLVGPRDGCGLKPKRELGQRDKKKGREEELCCHKRAQPKDEGANDLF